MCHCKHSRCLKKFCECWALQKECTSSCKCDNCGNIAGTDDYNKAMSKYKETVIQCTCKNSKCIKKYCICFLNGQKCGKTCKCIECKNVDDALFNALSIIPGNVADSLYNASSIIPGNVNDSIFNASSIIPSTVIEDAPVTPKRKSTKREISTPPKLTKTKRPKVDSKPIIKKMDDVCVMESFKINKEPWEYEEWDLSLAMWRGVR